jgi:hypothetical protein
MVNNRGKRRGVVPGVKRKKERKGKGSSRARDIRV